MTKTNKFKDAVFYLKEMAGKIIQSKLTKIFLIILIIIFFISISLSYFVFVITSPIEHQIFGHAAYFLIFALCKYLFED